MAAARNYRQKYLDTLSKGLENMWLKQRHTDLTVKVGGKAYACHKLLLGAVSNYFSKIVVNSVDTIEIDDMSSETFEELLQYMYTGKHEGVKKSPVDVLKAAVKIQLPHLQEICEDFLKSHMSTDNCIGYFILARELGCTSLEKQSWHYLLEFFQNVIDAKEFQNISYDDLVSIINDDDLNTPSEEVVCDAVLSWVSSDQESRSVYLEKLFDYIRFPFMEKPYILSLSQNPVLTKTGHGKKFLKICHDLLNNSDISGTVNPRQFHHRTEEMLCAIGSRSRHPNPETTEMKCYSFNKSLSYKMSKLPNDPGACFAACSSNNDVYVSGGYMGLTQILRFKAPESKWRLSGSLVEGRWGHGMTCLDGNLYIFGGSKKIPETLSSIELFSPETETSSIVGNLAVPVSFMSSAVIGDKIYIFGGKGEDRQICNKVQMFDTKSKECRVVADMPPVESTTSRSAVVGTTAFVFYGSGEVIKFREGEQPSLVGRIPKFDHFGVISYGDQVLIDGSFGNQSSTVVFEPETGIVSPFHRILKVNLCNFFCMKIVVSKNVMDLTV